MAIIMLSFMMGMLKERKKNALIFTVANLVFAGSLYLVRSPADRRRRRVHEGDDPNI